MENISNEMDSSDLFGISSGDSQENQILQMQPLAATGFSPAPFEHQASLESLMNFLDNEGDAQNSEIEPKREFLELTESPNQVECSNVELLSGLSSDTFENEEFLEALMKFLDNEENAQNFEIQAKKGFLEKDLELSFAENQDVAEPTKQPNNNQNMDDIESLCDASTELAHMIETNIKTLEEKFNKLMSSWSEQKGCYGEK